MIEQRVYNYIALPAGLLGYRLISVFDKKAKLNFERRGNVLADWELKLANSGEGKRVLVHISSVGEYLQVKPILRLIKERSCGMKLVLSFFSPSLEPLISKGVPADLVGYLPFDRKKVMERFLQMVNPGLIIFSCYDLWPNLIWEAKERGIKVLLVNGSLAENSGKLNPLVRWWFSLLYQELDLILAGSEEDKRRILRFKVSDEKVIATGNARFDESLVRIKAISAEDPLYQFFSPFKTGACLVIGSSWEEDERVLIPALAKLWKEGFGLRVIIAPHEPKPERTKRLFSEFSSLGAEPYYLSELENGLRRLSATCKVIIVDSVGKLYKLYKLGEMAFVGGSFKREVHNVLEPAGFGIPVLFGPKFKNSQEAVKLLEKGGGVLVKNSDHLCQELRILLKDEERRKDLGRGAYQLMLENQGAGERSWKLLLERFPEIFR